MARGGARRTCEESSIGPHKKASPGGVAVGGARQWRKRVSKTQNELCGADTKLTRQHFLVVVKENAVNAERVVECKVEWNYASLGTKMQDNASWGLGLAGPVPRPCTPVN